MTSLAKYKDLNGIPVTITTDNGANIRKACGDSSHIGAAHSCQTTFKWCEHEARKKCARIEGIVSLIEQVAAKANTTNLNRKLELAGYNRVPSTAATR